MYNTVNFNLLNEKLYIFVLLISYVQFYVLFKWFKFLNLKFFIFTECVQYSSYMVWIIMVISYYSSGILLITVRRAC